MEHCFQPRNGGRRWSEQQQVMPTCSIREAEWAEVCRRDFGWNPTRGGTPTWQMVWIPMSRIPVASELPLPQIPMSRFMRTIVSLRLTGFGYKRIARTLRITRYQARSYARAAGPDGVHGEMPHRERPATYRASSCARCAAAIVIRRRGRPAGRRSSARGAAGTPRTMRRGKGTMRGLPVDETANASSRRARAKGRAYSAMSSRSSWSRYDCGSLI